VAEFDARSFVSAPGRCLQRPGSRRVGGNPAASLRLHSRRGRSTERATLAATPMCCGSPTRFFLICGKMRPDYPWSSWRSLTRKGSRRPDGGSWTGAPGARSAAAGAQRVRRRGRFWRAPAPRGSDDLVTLVAMAVKTLEEPTLANIARPSRAPALPRAASGTRWAVSSVQNLLPRRSARAAGGSSAFAAHGAPPSRTSTQGLAGRSMGVPEYLLGVYG